MKNTWIGPARKFVSVTLLGAAGLWPAQEHEWTLLGGAALVALVVTAIVGLVWSSRARTARRFKAVMDAYADREIAREQRRKSVQVL
jgi:hypothetical protein